MSGCTTKRLDMKDRIAVYAGTFDPLTDGHLWMILEGLRVFDRVIVAVGVNPKKKPMFTLDERLDLIRESVKIFTSSSSRLEIESFDNQFLIHYADTKGARFLLRGLRNVKDFEEEKAYRNINGDLKGGITTFFLMPPRDICEVSSSIVKELTGPEGWEEIVRSYVPYPVFKKLKEKHRATTEPKL
jgi:pantetheine-phosphate adenylyltransferase